MSKFQNYQDNIRSKKYYHKKLLVEKYYQYTLDSDLKLLYYHILNNSFHSIDKHLTVYNYFRSMSNYHMP
mgnify:CR=1 FL=1